MCSPVELHRKRSVKCLCCLLWTRCTSCVICTFWGSSGANLFSPDPNSLLFVYNTNNPCSFKLLMVLYYTHIHNMAAVHHSLVDLNHWYHQHQSDCDVILPRELECFSRELPSHNTSILNPHLVMLGIVHSTVFSAYSFFTFRAARCLSFFTLKHGRSANERFCIGGHWQLLASSVLSWSMTLPI